ncbi:MAG: hypothetical protein K9L68_00095 [Spirochaetales bacterium]|nr:hypothetical protein [Spirochaetales bacterium]MCF7936978.1 hypothetical protein [Spirochaetales bacterium]
MKNRVMIVVCLLFALVAGLAVLGAEEAAEPKQKGLEVSLSVGATMFDGEAAGMLAARLSYGLWDWMEVVLDGTALHTLERSYRDEEGKAYQAGVGWASLGLRPHINLGERIEIGFPLTSGSGIVQYRYEYGYRDDLVWTDEILDQVTVGVTTVGMDILVNINGNFLLSVEAGSRFSSPLDSPLARDNALTSWYTGLRAGFAL